MIHCTLKPGIKLDLKHAYLPIYSSNLHQLLGQCCQFRAFLLW